MSKSRFQIGLDSFLQMVQMDKTSCTLRVESPEGTGVLYIMNGDLVDAECEGLSGTEAACEIVSWRDISFEFENICEERIRIINMPLMHLLMEGLKKRDDREAGLIPARKAAPQKQKKQPDKEKNIPILDIPEPSTYQQQPPVRLQKTPIPEPEPQISEPPVPASPAIPEIKTFKVEKTVRNTSARSNKRIVFAVSATVFAAALIAVYIFLFSADDSEYRKTIAEVEQTADHQEKERIIQQYVDAHRDAKNIEKALSMLEQIKKAKAEAEYQAAEKLVTELPPDDRYQEEAKRIYTEYLVTHENSTHRAEIETKISKIPEMHENALFAMIQGIPAENFEKRAAETSRFLKKFPTGKNTEKASAILEETEKLFFDMVNSMSSRCEETSDYTPCIEKIDLYRKIFGTDSRKYEIEGLMVNMAGERDLIQLKAKANEFGDNLEAKRDLYSNYLRNNRNSSAARSKIRDIVYEIEKNIQDKKDWESTRMYASDPSYPFRERIRRLESFIARKPNSIYAADAQKMLSSAGGGKIQSPPPETGELPAPEKTKPDPAVRKESTADTSDAYSKGTQTDYAAAWAVIEKTAGTRFRNNGNGTITDSMTGKTWCILDSKADTGRCLNYREAKAYVNSLSTGGYSGWRLPTSAELYAVYKNPPALPDTGSQWYWSSDAVWKGLNEVVKIVRPGITSEIKEESVQISECGYIRAVKN